MNCQKQKTTKSTEVRAAARIKQLFEPEQTPKGARRSRFEPSQPQTINISTNQVSFNNSFCLANIAINNMKSTVKSRERSEGEKSLQRTLQQAPITTNVQNRTNNSIGSQRNKKILLTDQNNFHMANIFPQTDTNKGGASLYQRIQAYKSGVGSSIEAFQDLMSPFNLPKSNKSAPKKKDNSLQLSINDRSYFQTRDNVSKSLNKSKLNTSQHKKTDEREKTIQTVQTVVPSRTVDSIESDGILNRENSYLLSNEQKRWEHLTLPITPEEALKYFSQHLTEFEKKEIMQYMNIFYIGHKANKIGKSNVGCDDEKGDYKYVIKDHIGYRYEILEPLGKGSFGSVIKVYDHKRKEEGALKIIRSKKKFFNQALVELKVLKYIKDNDLNNQTNIVKIKDFVIFRNHVCIVFELLSINLYEFLKSNSFCGVSLELIRRFAIQILQSLLFLEKAKIVHCDLKPENILLKQLNKSGIKIVDFGSSCFEKERVYTYIQSRFYRAPEVILGLPYSMSIDMWSFGCIIAELFIGYPIFPGDDEQEQIQMFMEVLGVPTQEILEPCQRRNVFFSSKSPYAPLLPPNAKGKIRIPGSRDINHYLKCNDEQFIHFVKQCFTWDMKVRMNPSEALVHPWILQGLPHEIRLQHLIQMQLNCPNLKLDELIRETKQSQQIPQQTIKIDDVSPAKLQVKRLSQEKKQPNINNYFVKKQPTMQINTKAQPLLMTQQYQKDILSTKSQNQNQNNQYSHYTGAFTTKNNQQNKNQHFIFNTMHNEENEKKLQSKERNKPNNLGYNFQN